MSEDDEPLTGNEWAKVDNLDEALGIVDIEYTPDGGTTPLVVKDCPPFGALIPFTSGEREELRSLQDLVARFARQQGQKHPLCVAVFGPPGSGKSFAVEQIRDEVNKNEKLKLSMTTINLTQVSDPGELASALAATLIAAAQEANTIPLVFFDEFDAPRDGALYGWLGWFLAPMNDGEFFHGGKNIKFKRAIYVFAGGTADTMDEFARPRDEAGFRAAKGPDFVSRLRGYMNVPGPNAEPHRLRRAVILRNELAKRVKRHGQGAFRVDRAVLTSLLQVGRYRHGARSIAALIELAELPDGTLGWELLPRDHLLALQVDRGPLDAKAIGGAIALSGFSKSDNPEEMEECWRGTAQGLWRAGATLAYAGKWIDPYNKRVQLMLALADELKELPVEPSPTKKRREHRRVRLLSFLNQFTAGAERGVVADIVGDEAEQRRVGLKLEERTYVEGDDLPNPADPDWKTRTIERFRRRLATSEACVARFAIGGDVEQSGERPSGVVEEVVLTLALRRPVYLAGGFEGATQDIGVLMGLSDIRTGVVPASLRGDHLGAEKRRWLGEIADRLRSPPWKDLLVMPEQQVAFLKDHAIDGPNWPCNGLTVEENRRLFRSADVSEVTRLVTRGLTRRFGGQAGFPAGR